REFAFGAKAAHGTAEAKSWAWDQALGNADLTNMQLEAVVNGMTGTPRSDLAEPYAEKYFNAIDGIWSERTFHMAEVLIGGLYPVYADPALLVELGDAWLEAHRDADRALRRMVIDNVERSRRTLKVQEYNAGLGVGAESGQRD
ncbi:ERAP1-like C-terminal domain-containing protein, partial [uncultured Bifidobacterium sp.]|uniref:ERAP1-like C-terminal domain-containing protein n=1 Tax=uncultured Bifidobacterium sp. TaxID=165187 RepID=UPI00261FCA1B